MALRNKKIKKDISNSPINLSGYIDRKKLKTVEQRVLFVLYISEQKFGFKELSTQQIFEIINNKLRIKTSLPAIVMSIKRSGNNILTVKKNGLRYHKIMADGVDVISKVMEIKEPKKVLDLIIPDEVVEGEKDYFKKVVKQVNGCYQDYYYDACFVMIRRIIETLIVDVFEINKQENEIQDSEGDYFQFSKLIDKTLENKCIKLSKIAKKDLKAIKKFGDTAAHNRKLNLKKPDIDKYSDSIRLIVEELINHKK